MGRKRRNRLLEFGKDLLIVLLALSAIYLTVRGQWSGTESGVGWLSGVLSFLNGGGGSETTTDHAQGQVMDVRPLRMAVSVAGVGTYGAQYDIAAVDKLSDKMFGLLGEALGSAGEPKTVSEQVWRDALTKQSNVYYDFQGQMPLAALYAWTEAGSGGALAGESTRRLLLAEDGAGALTLYYNNESTGLYYACETSSALNGHLQTAVVNYATGADDKTFAFEHRTGEGYEKLAPYVMLSKGSTVSARTVYRSDNPIVGGRSDENRVAMMEALSFHPQANTSYVAGGKQVVRDGADTLAVYDNGAVDYHGAAAEAPKYPIGSGQEPTLLELVEGTYHLAAASVGAYCGDSRTVGIYLQGVTRLDSGQWQVDYGYQVDGAVVQLGGEGYAARFLVSDNRVSDFYLVLRRYTATEESVSLLPELQAAAAMGALEADGKELLLAYVDGGGTEETLYPSWIAR